jgi:hypothetical protein
MKQIKPQQIWLQGVEYTAQYLQCTGTYDNYESTANIYYQLFEMYIDPEGNKSPSQQLAGGYQTISGQDYIDWGDVPAMSVNAWIYNWTAQQINVTIIP